MNGKQILAALGIASTLLAAGPSTGCASTGAGAPPAAKPDTAVKEMKTGVKTGELTPEVVTVTKKEYTFTVHTPEGWQGDTEAAKKYQGDVYFSPQAEAASPEGAKILVGVYHKLDENLELRLEGEIQSYRKRYPKLELGDLDAKHPLYATFQKVLSQPGDFYQYVTYLNPGSLYGYSFFVAMFKQKVPATPAELAAYKDIVQSLAMAPPSAKPTP